MNAIGTVHERNLLASSAPLAGNARLLEASLSSAKSVLNSNNMFLRPVECSSSVSAAIYDVSFGLAMEPIVSAMRILGETT